MSKKSIIRKYLRENITNICADCANSYEPGSADTDEWAEASWDTFKEEVWEISHLIDEKEELESTLYDMRPCYDADGNAHGYYGQLSDHSDELDECIECWHDTFIEMYVELYDSIDEAIHETMVEGE